MKEFLLRIWPADLYRRLIHVLGAAICAGTFAVAVYFYLKEARYLGHPDSVSFILDLAFDLVGAFIYAAVPILPYYTASSAAEKTGYSRSFLVASFLVFVVHLWLSINAVFFPKGSTSAIGVFFFPFYLSVPILLMWGVVKEIAGQPPSIKGEKK